MSRTPAGAVLRWGHTSQFEADDLDEARRLMDVAFAGDFDESDWEHALGGLHVLAWTGDTLIGHASVVQRRLLHRGVALRAGYVEAVGVHPGHQGRGLGGELMDIVECAIARAYDIGALATSEAAVTFYERRGWQQWQGRSSVLTPSGVTPTPEETDGIYVLTPNVGLNLRDELTCDWRDGDVW